MTAAQALAIIRASASYRAKFDDSGAARDGGASARRKAQALRAAAVRAARGEQVQPQWPPPNEPADVANPPSGPWATQRRDLAVAVARAAGLAELVIVHPRPSTPIDVTMVQKWVAEYMCPPGSIVLVVDSPRLDTISRLTQDHAQRRADGQADVSDIILVTPAAPDALENALGLLPGAIPVVETTSAVVAEVVRERPAINLGMEM